MPDVTHTACTIARIRAEEGRRPAAERLFDDPYAHLFVGGDAAEEVTALFLQVPFMRESVRLRTRYIDDAVRAAVAEGIDQLVVLGAGFDCRSLRLAVLEERSIGAFEIDFAHQLEEKRRALDSAGVALPGRVRHVACDFNAEFEGPLGAALLAEGFRRTARAIVTWEGVANYLDDAAVDRTLRFVAGLAAPGTRLVLNYRIGRFDPESFAGRLGDAGFDVLEDVAFDELFGRYLQGAPPAGGELFRILAAVSRRSAPR